MIINNQNELIVEGIITTSTKDRQGESNVISPNAFKNALKTLDKQGKFLPLLYKHGFDKIGKKVGGYVKVFFYSPENFDIDSPEILNMKIKGIVVINDQYFAEQYKAGHNCLSLRWRNKNIAKTSKGQIIATEIELIEVSLTENPVNTDCTTRIIDQDAIANKFLKNSVYLNGEEVKVKSLDGEYCMVEFVSPHDNIKSFNQVWLGNLTDQDGNSLQTKPTMEKLYNQIIESAKSISPETNFEGAKIELTSPTTGKIETENLKIFFESIDGTIQAKMIEKEEVEDEESIAKETKIQTVETEINDEAKAEIIKNSQNETLATNDTKENIVEISESLNADTNAVDLKKDNIKSVLPDYGSFINYLLQNQP